MVRKNVPALPQQIAAPIPPEDLITIEVMARRLRSDVPEAEGVAWVREKCRRRCPNPIPVWNLGRHLLFDWVQVSEWIRNSPRPIHARHRRRKKTDVPSQMKKAA